MPELLPADKAPRLTMVQWLICIIASIGFAFDIYELLMLPLIVRPAMMELQGVMPSLADGSANPEFAMWIGRLFYIPAVVGGLFGMLGGYLTDKLGRRRVLTWSILLYAASAFASGYSTSMWMLLFLRCTTFVGVCVEFVAAVAWLAELFPDHKQRERVLGYTQAFSSFGGILVALVNGWIVNHAGGFPAITLPEWISLGGTISDPHAAWRYTLMSGLIPAIPLIIIRPFLPESPAWAAKKAAGTLKRPSFRALFSPEFRRTTIVTTIMFACSYGAAFGAIQQIPRIVPGLPEIRQKVAKQSEGKTAAEIKKLESITSQSTAANVTKVQELGGLLGRVALAILAVVVVSRRSLIRVFQVPGLLIVPFVFAYCNTQSLNLMYFGMFFVAFFTVAQFSFWGNYLPLVYPVHLRGTGESFAANVGGRMIGTSFAWFTSWVATMSFIPGSGAPAKIAYTAAMVGFGVYFVGFICSFFLPEPQHADSE